MATVMDRVFAIRDDLYLHMKLGERIPIYNYTGGTGVLLDYAISRDIITDSLMPDIDAMEIPLREKYYKENVYQYNFTIEFTFLEKF
jgi:hypothetical protein